MGFLDRLDPRERTRRRGSAARGESADGAVTDVARAADVTDGAGATDAAGDGAGGGSTGPAAGSDTRAAVAPTWSALPPIQRALAPAPGGVADSAFGGRLPTWQNPSFAASASHAVLDGRSSTVLGGMVHQGTARPTTGLERPAAALPTAAGQEPVVQRAPAVPLRY
ncbi:hypothetical protein ACFC02_41530, partial [Streptomyces sp. NPDC056160]